MVMHNANVIHRDLKPENIFIESLANGKMSAKIGDFGLSRMVTGGLSRNSSVDTRHSSKNYTTQFSSVAGTEAYMAPEILKHYQKGTKPQRLEVE